MYPQSTNARRGQKRASIPWISIGELPVGQPLPSFQEEHMGKTEPGVPQGPSHRP